MTILIPIIGFLCTTLLLLLIYPRQGKKGRLDALFSVDETKALSSLDPKTLEYRLLAGGLRIKPATFSALRMAVGACGAALGWLFLPGIPSLIIEWILFNLLEACLNFWWSTSRLMEKCIQVCAWTFRSANHKMINNLNKMDSEIIMV